MRSKAEVNLNKCTRVAPENAIVYDGFRRKALGTYYEQFSAIRIRPFIKVLRVLNRIHIIIHIVRNAADGPKRVWPYTRTMFVQELK